MSVHVCMYICMYAETVRPDCGSLRLVREHVCVYAENVRPGDGACNMRVCMYVYTLILSGLMVEACDLCMYVCMYVC